MLSSQQNSVADGYYTCTEDKENVTLGLSSCFEFDTASAFSVTVNAGVPSAYSADGIGHGSSVFETQTVDRVAPDGQTMPDLAPTMHSNSGVGSLQSVFMRELGHLREIWAETVRQQQVGQRLAHDAFKAACSSHTLFLEILNDFQTRQEASFHLVNHSFEQHLDELLHLLGRNTSNLQDELGSHHGAPEPVVLSSVAVQTTRNQQQVVESDHERFEDDERDDVSTVSDQSISREDVEYIYLPSDGPVIG